MPNTHVKKYSITLSGHRTSLTLEPVFWSVLKSIAAKRNVPLNTVIGEIDAQNTSGNLSSATRVYTVERLLKQLHKFETQDFT
tara:strand:- start:20 stop:268 length:249 start_codon:yes stop_codon:yes gene_type:complete